jgi:hypothetical protein
MKKQCLILIVSIMASAGYVVSQSAMNEDSLYQNTLELYYTSEYEKALTDLEFLINEFTNQDYYLLASKVLVRLDKRDKAFNYLDKTIELDTTGNLYYTILHEHAFDKLHRYKSWRLLISQQKKVNESFETENDYNSKLRKKLAKMIERDQRHLLKIMKRYTESDGKVTFGLIVIALRQQFLQKRNMRKVSRLFSKIGYPSKSAVGSKMAGYPFLVIQHSTLEVQEKYLPVLEKAAAEGSIEKSDIALLTDRIKLGNGGKQIYGSQTTGTEDGGYKLHPIENYEEVNIRRKEVGLEPLEKYLKRMETICGSAIILPDDMDLDKIKIATSLEESESPIKNTYNTK